MRSLRFELGAVGSFEAGHVAGVFDGGALHAETNSEEGNFVFAGVLNGVHHSLNAALAESAGDKDAVVTAQACGGGFWLSRFLPLRSIRGRFFVGEPSRRGVRLRANFCRRLRAEHICRLRRCALRRRDDASGGRDRATGCMLAGFSTSFRWRKICVSRPSRAELDGDGVNRVDVFHGNYAGFGDVAEERDFLFQIFGDVAIAAAEQECRAEFRCRAFL